MVELFGTSLRLFNIGWIWNPVWFLWVVCLRGSLREGAISLGSLVSTVLIGLIIGESGLFGSVFWASESFNWTGVNNSDGLMLASSSGLVITMTIILSSLSVTASRQYLHSLNGTTMIQTSDISLSMCLIALFVITLINEWLCLDLHINDCGTGTMLYLLTGLHFGHVVVGALLFTLRSLSTVHLWKLHDNTGTELYIAKHCAPILEPFVIVYLHFVEAVWIAVVAIIYL